MCMSKTIAGFDYLKITSYLVPDFEEEDMDGSKIMGMCDVMCVVENAQLTPFGNCAICGDFFRIAGES